MQLSKITAFLAIFVVAGWMLVGGVTHMINPEFYFKIVPDMFPKLFVVYASGIVEILIGLGVLWQRTRAMAGLAFALLCLGFLPLHLWDFWRPDPVFQPPVAASVRVVLQFILMGIGLYVFRAYRSRAT